MTSVHWLTEEPDEESYIEPAPQPFARVLTAPPGLPWEQARAAGLEAKIGAPLPISQLSWQLRRLEPWRNGKAARFAAVYVRADAVKDRFEAKVDADGKPLTVVFLSSREQVRRTRVLAAVAGAFAISAFAAVTGTGLALDTRADSAARLTLIERMARQRMARSERAARLAIQDRALAAEDVDGRRLADFLDDVAWASQAKADGARVRGLHWQEGYLAIEARGDQPPVADPRRPTEKFGKPVRDGVFLWAVAPERAR
jgi:hypothetical protein